MPWDSAKVAINHRRIFLIGSLWFLGYALVYGIYLSGNRNSVFILSQTLETMKNNESYDAGSRTCQPSKNIFFLKAHKCGSSSIQNIFMRYGKKHNLSFVLPNWGNYLDGSGKPFHPSMVAPSGMKRYNIFCHHTVFNLNEIRTLLPDAKFISVLRDPAQVLDSLYTFFLRKKDYGVEFKDFIQQPEKYVKKPPQLKYPPTRNSMLYDFGLPVSDFDKMEKIVKKIEEIKNEFDLIMIAERMDESLVLLRDLLCWKWADVITLRQNSRMSKNQSLATSQIKHSEWWSAGDVLLYKTFEQIFEQKVQDYGYQRMKNDVKVLRTYTDKYYSMCVNRTVESRAMTAKEAPKMGYFPQTVYYFESKSNEQTCLDLVKPEMVFTNELINAQRACKGTVDSGSSPIWC